MTTEPQATADPAALQAQVSGSSFYAAMRVMPKAERAAMFAIYSFCRMVDDIADDGTRPRAQRATALDRWRADLAALYADRPAGPASFLKDAVHNFGLRQADFLAVIDGMADGCRCRHPRARSRDAQSLLRSGGGCGRSPAIRIFGMEERPGLELAHRLGRALQLTNILRDLDEDAAIGRLYLPRELLTKAGIATADPNRAIADPRVDGACRDLAALALEHFAAADRVMRARPRGRLLAPRLMSAVYRTILQQMIVEGWVAPRRRVRIGKARLLWLVARCSVFG